MALKRIDTEIPGVLIFEPDRFGDERGFFNETYHIDKYSKLGLDATFLQDNHSMSTKNVLRGLHYQLKRPQGKLVYVVTGEIFDVAVDIRRGSPTFGKWVGVNLSSENGRQLYIPPGFAHGFCVLTDEVNFLYKCTDVYQPDDDHGILWSDEDISIDWPVKDPLISQKDSQLSGFNETQLSKLPVYGMK